MVQSKEKQYASKEVFTNGNQSFKTDAAEGRWMQFNQGRHPRPGAVFRAIQAKALKEGTVIEMKVTTPEGKSLVASIRLTEADMELFRQAADSVKNN